MGFSLGLSILKILEMEVDLEDVRARIDKGEIIPEQIVSCILDKLKEVLYDEDILLVLESPIVICGDIHGQYEDLVELFRNSGDHTVQKYLFMGDYVDRGYYSVNTFLLLAISKLQYRGHYYLLRGNHESRSVTRMYGFYTEIITNYGHAALWNQFMSVFDLLPYAALIDNNIFSVHGGLSPKLSLVEQLLSEPNRHCEISTEGVLTDLTWSDPEEIGEALFRFSSRGSGCLFGPKASTRFCHLNRLRLITRSHQLVQEGYQYYFGDENHFPPGRVLNVWSAPNYGYKSGNKASIMKLGFKGNDSWDMVIFEEAKVRIASTYIEPSQYFA
jgi:diadenosine tetraphosphatase ApaH/serine/threonine PP2A family protein phosphatase